jgi:hypothetical protein
MTWLRGGGRRMGSSIEWARRRRWDWGWSMDEGGIVGSGEGCMNAPVAGEGWTQRLCQGLGGETARNGCDKEKRDNTKKENDLSPTILRQSLGQLLDRGTLEQPAQNYVCSGPWERLRVCLVGYYEGWDGVISNVKNESITLDIWLDGRGHLCFCLIGGTRWKGWELLSNYISNYH